MIVFKGIRIEGFCGIAKELNYKFNLPGLNIIRGGNGIGKTTIFSAMHWALFGSTLKGSNNVETWLDKQPPKYRGTRVELDFDIGEDSYSIVRCHKFKGTIEGAKGNSRLLLYKGGVYDESLRDKPDVQAKVIEILGYSSELFKVAVLFGQKLTRFIGESGPKKKELMEEAFEKRFISEGRERAIKERKAIQEDIAPLKERLIKIEAKEETLEEQVESLELKIEIAKDDNTLKEVNSKIKKLAGELEHLQRLIDQAPTKKEVDKQKALLEKYNEQLEERSKKQELYGKECTRIESDERELTAAKMNLHNAQQKQKEFEENPTCTSCGSKLPKEKRVAHSKEIKKTLKLFRNNVQELSTRINQAYERRDKLKAELDKNTIVKKVDDITSKIRDLESSFNVGKTSESKRLAVNSHLKDLKSQKKNLKGSIKALENSLGDHLQTLGELKVKGQKIVNRIKKYEKREEAFTWVIDDALSNKGIKAFVFSHMVAKINEELEKYHNTLGFGVDFDIDLEGKRKDLITTIFQGDNIRDYKELSGGQQQLVDVAIAFAWHDVASEDKPSNVLLMDEIFESLDDENIGKVEELLRVKSKDFSVHLITHNKTFKPTNCRDFQITTKNNEILIL